MNLDDWRSRINSLDEEILKLLNQRGTAALRIGELKRQQGLPYFIPEREAQVLDRLVGLTGGPLPGDAIRAIWREILSASLALEHPLPVAYLGPPGTFTHQAAVRRFGSSAQLLAVRTIAEIFDEVERGRAEFGVVPVENSTDGAVNVTLDRLLDSDVTITGEMTLDISQHLITRAGELGEVKVVCSHPQGLAQCRGWLAAHLPEAITEEMPSTAAAVERARDDATVAAIASDIAAQVHGVPILRRRIEDNPANSTRFLVIGRRAGRAHRARQDVHPLLDEERAGRALQHPEAVRGPPAQPDQDRVPTHKTSPLGVRQLRGLRGA